MIEPVGDLPVARQTFLVCISFAGLTWIGEISYQVKHSAKTLIGSLLTGERRLRVFEGTGRLPLSSYPSSRQALSSNNDATIEYSSTGCSFASVWPERDFR